MTNTLTLEDTNVQFNTEMKKKFITWAQNFMQTNSTTSAATTPLQWDIKPACIAQWGNNRNEQHYGYFSWIKNSGIFTSPKSETTYILNTQTFECDPVNFSRLKANVTNPKNNATLQAELAASLQILNYVSTVKTYFETIEKNLALIFDLPKKLTELVKDLHKYPRNPLILNAIRGIPTYVNALNRDLATGSIIYQNPYAGVIQPNNIIKGFEDMQTLLNGLRLLTLGSNSLIQNILNDLQLLTSKTPFTEIKTALNSIATTTQSLTIHSLPLVSNRSRDINVKAQTLKNQFDGYLPTHGNGQPLSLSLVRKNIEILKKLATDESSPLNITKSIMQKMGLQYNPALHAYMELPQSLDDFVTACLSNNVTDEQYLAMIFDVYIAQIFT